jgi:hypothetical protein
MNRLIVSLVWGVLFVSTGFDGIHAAAQSQGVPSIDDLYSSIKSHREEIVSGSMTYRFLEHDYGTENNAVSPETPPDEAAYLLGPRTQEALCTLEFKKRGDILLWRMSCRNVRDNKDVSPGIVQKFDLDYRLSIRSMAKHTIGFHIAEIPDLNAYLSKRYAIWIWTRHSAGGRRALELPKR